MAWFNFITDIFKGGKDIAEVFVENKENKGARAHLEQMADMKQDMSVINQFAAEFHQRAQRTWWDSLVDGLNRLPRPLITYAVLGFFVLAPLDTLKFMEIAKAYEVMPSGYWALLSIIITFYFGGRMQIKSQDMALKGNALNAARDLIAMRKEFRELRVEEAADDRELLYRSAIAEGKEIPENRVVTEWRRNHKEG
ncbi:3TM-type holin [Pseudomonadota bacterium]